MKKIKPYLPTIILAAGLGILAFFQGDFVAASFTLSFKSAFTMLGILPPILIIVNLLDVWVPREVVVRHMGEESGLRGYFWALFLGTMAAGPLYAAFPVAALLARKGAGLSYIAFLLGVWTTTKLPIFLYELNFFGMRFTAVHVLTGLIFYILYSHLMEKILLKSRKEEIYTSLSRAGGHG